MDRRDVEALLCDCTVLLSDVLAAGSDQDKPLGLAHPDIATFMLLMMGLAAVHAHPAHYSADYADSLATDLTRAARKIREGADSVVLGMEDGCSAAPDLAFDDYRDLWTWWRGEIEEGKASYMPPALLPDTEPPVPSGRVNSALDAKPSDC